jgi:glycosyl transferase family 87
MTGIQSLELRSLVGALGSGASVAVWRWASRLSLARERFRRRALAGFALTRIAFFLGAFFVLHIAARGDILLYMQEAAHVYAGQLVYRDFITPHAPLSAYLFAAMLQLRYDPRTIILFSVLFDVAAFALWLRFSAHMQDALMERRAALLMIASPVSLLTVAIEGQMNSLIALGLAWSAVAAFERRDTLSGFAAALPGVLVKFLSWIFAPILFFAARRRLVWCAGFLAITAGVYAAFVAAGANVLVPLHAEGAHKTTSNITFLIELASGIDLGNRLPDMVLAAAWIGVIALGFRAMRDAEDDENARRKIVLIALTAVMMVVQVFSKNTWDRYLVMTMFPLCWLAAEFNGAQMALYCGWIAVNVVYRSAWSSLTGEASSLTLHHALMQGNGLAWSMLAGEVLQTAGNIAVLVFAVRRLVFLSRSRIGAAPARPATALEAVTSGRGEVA